MKYLIISYKSRTNLMKLQQLMRARGLNSSIISTPRSISVSCGLSIKTDIYNYFFVKKLITQLNFSDLRGIFLYEHNSMEHSLKRID